MNIRISTVSDEMASQVPNIAFLGSRMSSSGLEELTWRPSIKKAGMLRPLCAVEVMLVLDDLDVPVVVSYKKIIIIVILPGFHVICNDVFQRCAFRDFTRLYYL